MPWTPRDAPRYTKAANTSSLSRLWAKAANAALKANGDDAKAIRIANAAVKKAKATR